jgi:hypothetical protein
MRNREEVGAMLKWVLAGVVCFGLTGCDGGPLSPSERRELEAARAKWNSANIHSYTVEQRVSCFCSPHLNFMTRVTVEADVVVEALPLEELPFGFEPSLLGWVTVDEAFDQIENLARSTHLQALEVEYDPVLGYPTRVSNICDPEVQDCGSTLTLQNLTPG